MLGQVVERFMNSPANGASNGLQARTSWTLIRDGQVLTCILLQRSAHAYVVRLEVGGRRLLDEICNTPQHAMARSLDALGAFLVRGWVFKDTAN